MTARTEDNDLGVLLLERYCSGTASPEETAQIGVWFERNPDQRSWYERLRASEDLRGGALCADVRGGEARKAAWSEIIRVALQQCPETEAQLLSVAQLDGEIAVRLDAAFYGRYRRRCN